MIVGLPGVATGAAGVVRAERPASGRCGAAILRGRNQPAALPIRQALKEVMGSAGPSCCC